jgi:hypothetical protein
MVLAIADKLIKLDSETLTNPITPDDSRIQVPLLLLFKRLPMRA